MVKGILFPGSGTQIFPLYMSSQEVFSKLHLSKEEMLTLAYNKKVIPEIPPSPNRKAFVLLENAGGSPQGKI